MSPALGYPAADLTSVGSPDSAFGTGGLVSFIQSNDGTLSPPQTERVSLKEPSEGPAFPLPRQAWVGMVSW